jgi:tRNA-dihydrouridine synthase
MRRHYANYFKGIANFKEHRIKLVSLETEAQIEDVLNDIGNKFELEFV